MIGTCASHSVLDWMPCIHNHMCVQCIPATKAEANCQSGQTGVVDFPGSHMVPGFGGHFTAGNIVFGLADSTHEEHDRMRSVTHEIVPRSFSILQA